MTDFKEAFNNLKFQKHETLNGQGFVCLVDVMGDESSIVQAARVSYGEGTKTPSDDATLIRYLMRHRHTTPLEMVELKFLVYVPMDCWRQWIRHRTASVNEYSTRYSEAIDEMAETPPDKWRMQSGTNKQGSSGYLEGWPEGFAASRDTDGYHLVQAVDGTWYDAVRSDECLLTVGGYLSSKEKDLHIHATRVYNKRLALGVAREQARKDLPLSTFTKAYWKIDLHNLLHFLSLRMDKHAQAEIREYATTIGERIVAPLYPNVWQAFLDYRFNAITLTGPEVELVSGRTTEMTLSKREEAEFREKLDRLGI